MDSNPRCLLVSIDGMRPDALMQADAPFLQEMARTGVCTLQARTVMPSVTLPCHTSMFFGVEPERHGITTNTWTPQVRPVIGLIEALSAAGRRCAFFYNWEPLRDLAPPEQLAYSFFVNNYEEPDGDAEIARLAAERLVTSPVDFAFLYLGYTDTAGHRSGWMSEPYLQAIAEADRCIARVCAAIGQAWHVLVTSDHGGHGKSHGTEMAEDMTTPILFWGPTVTAGDSDARFEERPLRITDIAPTVAHICGVPPGRDWIGRSFAVSRPANDTLASDRSS